MTRTENLQRAAICKFTSVELVLYLNYAVSKYQNFSYTAIHGSEFDISFLD